MMAPPVRVGSRVVLGIVLYGGALIGVPAALGLFPSLTTLWPAPVRVVIAFVLASLPALVLPRARLDAACSLFAVTTALVIVAFGGKFGLRGGSTLAVAIVAAAPLILVEAWVAVRRRRRQNRA